MSQHQWINYLQKFRAAKGSAHTHTSLGNPLGCFYVPAEHFKEFMIHYCDAMEQGCDLHMTESNRPIGPLKIDLDFRFAAPSKDEEKKTVSLRQYRSKDIDDIVQTYADILFEYFDIRDDQLSVLQAYVMEKKTAHLTPQNVVKDGLHIMFPHLVTKPSVQLIIRTEILSRLDPLFRRMQCINSTKDIVDEAIIERNNWMMYGSKKPNCEAYLLTKVYDVQPRETGLKMVCKKYSKDKQENLCDLVTLLSIRNKYDELKVRQTKLAQVREFEEEQERRLKKMELSRLILSDAVNNTKNKVNDAEFHLIEKLVNILSIERIDAFDTWLRLGWCLRNIDHRLLSVWDAVSKKSTKYTKGKCDELWMTMKEDRLRIGTLHMWAKEDNPREYQNVIANDLRALILKSLTSCHTDIAHVIRHMYKHRFVCTKGDQVWYEFKNHRWVCLNKKGTSLRNLISDEVWDTYMSASADLTLRAVQTRDNEEEKLRLQDQAMRLNEIAKKLKNCPFKNNIMNECADLFCDEKFEDMLDSNINLIGFPNGVYDLDTDEFRDGMPDDYISLCAGCDYIEFNPDHEYVRAIKTYLSQVFTKADVREYVLKLFGSFLHGSVKDQKFYIWTGSGSNSKSLLVELFTKTFGEYCCIFPVTMLTQKRAASNAPNSELARAKGRRFGLMSEPSDSEKLNVGFMKELTGGDKVLTRKLFNEPFEFVPQFKVVLTCNELPSVPSSDGGTWRRIRVVEFTSTFVESPKNENEFPIDYDLRNNFEHWKPHFMAMLLQYYKLYKKDGIHEPEDVLKCTREYKQMNDHMSDYVYNCIERKDNAFLSLNDAFLELKSWVRNDNITMKVPTKSELEKYLSKVLVKSTTKNNFRGYSGFRLKMTDHLVE